MKTATTQTYGIQGIRARPVSVDAHISGGLPAFNIVGLAETIVRESRERVRSAILNSGFEFPNKRITLNLSPLPTCPNRAGVTTFPLPWPFLLPAVRSAAANPIWHFVASSPWKASAGRCAACFPCCFAPSKIR